MNYVIKDIYKDKKFSNMNKLKILSILLMLLVLFGMSSCILLDQAPMRIILSSELDYSSNIGNRLSCQIGLGGIHAGMCERFCIWQYMEFDCIATTDKKNIVVRYKDIETPVKALRIQETSRNKMWWKKYWTRENVEWRKVNNHAFTNYAFMKLDFEKEMAMGDFIQIIERDFPQKGDSVVVGIRIPDNLSDESYFRWMDLDADLQLHRLKQAKNNIEER